MRSFYLLPLAPLLALASPITFDSSNQDAAAAPILSSHHSEQIPDSYMIVFKEDVSHFDAASHHVWVQDLHVQVENAKLKKRDLSGFISSAFQGLKHTYHIPGGILGYSGHFDEEVIESVRRHPQVSQLPSSCYYPASKSSLPNLWI